MLSNIFFIENSRRIKSTNGFTIRSDNGLLDETVSDKNKNYSIVSIDFS